MTNGVTARFVRAALRPHPPQLHVARSDRPRRFGAGSTLTLSPRLHNQRCLLLNNKGPRKTIAAAPQREDTEKATGSFPNKFGVGIWARGGSNPCYKPEVAVCLSWIPTLAVIVASQLNGAPEGWRGFVYQGRHSGISRRNLNKCGWLLQ